MFSLIDNMFSVLNSAASLPYVGKFIFSMCRRLFVYLRLILDVSDDEDVLFIHLTIVCDAQAVGHFFLLWIERWKRFSKAFEHQIWSLCRRCRVIRLWADWRHHELTTLPHLRLIFRLILWIIFVANERYQDHQDDDCCCNAADNCHQEKFAMRFTVDRYFGHY